MALTAVQALKMGMKVLIQTGLGSVKTRSCTCKSPLAAPRLLNTNIYMSSSQDRTPLETAGKLRKSWGSKAVALFSALFIGSAAVSAHSTSLTSNAKVQEESQQERRNLNIDGRGMTPLADAMLRIYV